MRHFGRALAAILTLVAPVLGSGFGPLERSWIAKEAQWLVHMDFEAGASTVFARLLDSVRGHEAVVATAKDELGIDPRRDILGVTIYGNGSVDEPVVVLLSTTAKLDGLADRLDRLNKRVERFDVGTRQAFSFNEDASRRFCGIVNTGTNRRLVVVTESRPVLERALAVLDSPSLALDGAAAGRMAQSPAAGSVFFVAIGDTRSAFGSLAAGSTMLKTARSISIDLGERNGSVFGRLGAIMDSDSTAAGAVQMAQGMLAMARMALSGEKLAEHRAAVAMLETITLSAKGTLLSADFTMPVEQLFEAAAPLARQARIAFDRLADDPSRRSLKVDFSSEPKPADEPRRQ
ncbi:MAG: hypothetical protein ACKVW3_08430 [Phycisphaerales bacterium]